MCRLQEIIHRKSTQCLAQNKCSLTVGFTVTVIARFSLGLMSLIFILAQWRALVISSHSRNCFQSLLMGCLCLCTTYRSLSAVTHDLRYLWDGSRSSFVVTVSHPNKAQHFHPSGCCVAGTIVLSAREWLVDSPSREVPLRSFKVREGRKRRKPRAEGSKVRPMK